MKKKLIVSLFILLFSSVSVLSQVDYSDPEIVAQSFLDMCIDGQRLEAAEKYATNESMSQIEVLIRQMVMNDKPLKNQYCKYFVESCALDTTHLIANCLFRKVCEDGRNNSKGSLILKIINEKWLVEYVYKRDKYL